MMKREWDPVPWPLKENELYQLEIFRGLIFLNKKKLNFQKYSGHLFYRHDGSDNLIDSFDFKFRDFYGLETDLETMHIRATSKDMLIWVRKLIILMMTKIYKINFFLKIKLPFLFTVIFEPISASLAKERMSTHCIRPYSKNGINGT